MSIRVKIEAYRDDSFKVTLGRGERTVSGVSAGVIAELLKLDDNNKFKVAKKDVDNLIKNTSGVSKNERDRTLLEAFMLLSKD